MSIASIRRAQSGATKKLKDFKKAFKAIKKKMVQAVQKTGRRRFKMMHKRYEKALYANRQGKLSRVRKASKAHNLVKQELGLDPRPGHMRKGVSKHMRSPKSFKKNQTGFIINIKAPNLTVTGKTTGAAKLRAIAGKAIITDKEVVGHQVKFQKTTRKSFRVNAYIDAFSDQKAPGLGSITDADGRAIDKAAKTAAEKHLANVTKQAASLSRQAVNKLVIDVGRWV